MGIVKGVINSVKNMGNNVGKPPKKQRGKFKPKRKYRPGRAVTRGGGGLR